MDASCLLSTIILLCHGSQFYWSHISSVMVSVLASKLVDHGFKPLLGRAKDYNIWYLLIPC